MNDGDKKKIFWTTGSNVPFQVTLEIITKKQFGISERVKQGRRRKRVSENK